MADSVTTQQADIKKLLAEADAIIANCRLKREAHEKALAEAKQAEREAHEKLLAEANAIIANSQLKREAHEKALAEANSQLKREAHKKALAEAEPFLTTSQWLSAIFIAASLAGF